jgi:outer membrane protein
MNKPFVIAVATVMTLLGGRSYAQNAQKIGYTNIDYIVANHPKSKQIETQLTTTRTQYSNAVQEKVKTFQDKLAVYQKGAAGMSEVIRTDREKELQNLQQSIEEFQRNAEAELQKKQQELLDPVLQEIDKAVKDVAKENNYTYVINTDVSPQLTPVLLYVTEDFNITDLVFKKLGITPPKPNDPAKPAAATPPTGSTTPKPTTPAPRKN